MTKVHHAQMKDCRSMAMHEALLFLKSKCEILCKHLTQEHRKLLKQFFEYRERTHSRLVYLEEQDEKYCETIRNWALIASTTEGMYALDEKNALQMYNCLVPKMKEHV